MANVSVLIDANVNDFGGEDIVSFLLHVMLERCNGNSR